MKKKEAYQYMKFQAIYILEASRLYRVMSILYGTFFLYGGGCHDILTQKYLIYWGKNA